MRAFGDWVEWAFRFVVVTLLSAILALAVVDHQSASRSAVAKPLAGRQAPDATPANREWPLSVTPASLKWPLQTATLDLIADFDNEMARRLRPDVVASHYSRMVGGLAILADPGQPVLAMLSGKVWDAAFEPDGFGNVVTIDHGKGLRTVYGHLSRAAVRPGQVVSASAVVGYVGNTGLSFFPHLYVAIRVVQERPGTASKWMPYATVNPLGFLEPGSISFRVFPD